MRSLSEQLKMAAGMNKVDVAEARGSGMAGGGQAQ